MAPVTGSSGLTGKYRAPRTGGLGSLGCSPPSYPPGTALLARNGGKPYLYAADTLPGCGQVTV
ncbi:MAG: hypothetical protein ACREMW_11780, partial [Gemmatimonadales bacterium]